MILKLRAISEWQSNQSKLTPRTIYQSNFHKVDEDGVVEYLIQIDDTTEEYFPDICFEILCPFCDGKGKEVINVNLIDFDEDEMIEVPDEPISIDCNFCDGKKTVSIDEINKLNERKSAWCQCHHVKANEQQFIDDSWVHIICGKKIQEI